MSIKIRAEKIAKIESHRTRFTNLTSHTFEHKKLIKQAYIHLKQTKFANKQFKKISLPYLENTNIIYYTTTSITVESNNPIIKSKVKELHNQFLKIINKYHPFEKVQKINIYIKQTESERKGFKPNQKALEAITELKRI